MNTASNKALPLHSSSFSEGVNSQWALIACNTGGLRLEPNTTHQLNEPTQVLRNFVTKKNKRLGGASTSATFIKILQQSRITGSYFLRRFFAFPLAGE